MLSRPRLRGAIFRVEKMSTAMVVRTWMLEVGPVVHRLERVLLDACEGGMSDLRCGGRWEPCALRRACGGDSEGAGERGGHSPGRCAHPSEGTMAINKRCVLTFIDIPTHLALPGCFQRASRCRKAGREWVDAACR